MLRKMYDWMMNMAGHRHAKWILGIVSFTESSFFPLPPDPLYLAMALQRRSETWNLALLCTVTSVIGGYLGYAIGYGFYETAGKYIIDFYGLGEFEVLKTQFNEYGFWIIALKGLTPIPFKIVTITSGVTGFDLLTFTAASILARGFRFAYVAALLWFFGPQIKDYIEKNLYIVTMIGLIALVGGFILIKYFF